MEIKGDKKGNKRRCEMRMKKILSIVLVLALLASAVPLAVTPAVAISEYEEKLPCDDGDDELTKAELSSAILPYMLDEGDFKLDDVGDAAYVHAYWNGKPKTITDAADRLITQYRPIERFVATHRGQFDLLRILKVETDRVVGAERQISSADEYKLYFAEYQDKPSMGFYPGPNVEAVVGVRPDAILFFGSTEKGYTDVLESAGITVIYIGDTRGSDEDVPKTLRNLGYIFGQEDEAEEFIDWYEDLINLIKEKVENIPEEDKPKVYYEVGSRQKYRTGGEPTSQIGRTGGKNIVGDELGTVYINAEVVAKQNPDIIVITGGSSSGYGSGYCTDDTTELRGIREELMNRELLQNVTAVKTGKVYAMSKYITARGPMCGGRGFIQAAYQAKWFNPTYFENFNPKAIHQEYLTRFQGLDWDLDEHGVYVYHPEEHPDGN
jgi:iron complex transport system substrate-binding protein